MGFSPGHCVEGIFLTCGSGQAPPRQRRWRNNRKRRAVHINLRRELGRAFMAESDGVGNV